MRRTVFMMTLLTALAGCRIEVPDGFTALTPETHTPFPISGAATHAGTDCNTCHGAFDTFREFTCIDCHEPGREAHSEADLASTHAEMSGYVFASAACYGCHPDGTPGISREDHGRYFPVGETTFHFEVDCAECHVDAGNREVVDCAICHRGRTAGLDATHAGLGDYVAQSSPACLLCHPDGDTPITISGHRAEGVNVSGPHDACTECHVARRSDRPFPAAAWDGFDDCGGSCHEHTASKMNEEHHEESGYTTFTDYRNCLRCHPGARKD